MPNVAMANDGGQALRVLRIQPANGTLSRSRLQ